MSAQSIQDDFHDTVIVGGGMSGIGAAKRLCQRHESFLMITPEIGGRVRTSPDGTVNYGAYYVTDDYERTLPLVDRIDRVSVTDSWFHTCGQRYGFRSLRAAKHMGALYRFIKDLRTFRRHFNHMNQGADRYSRRELIAADPLLRRTYNENGGDYIRRRRLEGLFDDFIDPLLWASFFCRPAEVSTFFLLAASLPLIVPMHTFVLNDDAATAGYRDRILLDNVVEISRDQQSPLVRTANGRTIRCKNVIVATPMNVTNRLLGQHAQPIRGGVDVSFYHVRGKLRARYDGATRNFFHSRDTAVLSREKDGSYLYFYQKDEIDRYFEHYEVIVNDHWKPALFFIGNELIEANPAPNLYIASDHDVPSMENAFLNGQYAANLMLRQGCDRRGQESHQGFHLPTLVSQFDQPKTTSSPVSL